MKRLFADTLFKRLFVLMWFALVASTLLGYFSVHTPFERPRDEAHGRGAGLPPMPSLPPHRRPRPRAGASAAGPSARRAGRRRSPTRRTIAVARLPGARAGDRRRGLRGRTLAVETDAHAGGRIGAAGPVAPARRRSRAPGCRARHHRSSGNGAGVQHHVDATAAAVRFPAAADGRDLPRPAHAARAAPHAGGTGRTGRSGGAVHRRHPRDGHTDRRGAVVAARTACRRGAHRADRPGVAAAGDGRRCLRTRTGRRTRCRAMAGPGHRGGTAGRTATRRDQPRRQCPAPRGHGAAGPRPSRRQRRDHGGRRRPRHPARAAGRCLPTVLPGRSGPRRATRIEPRRRPRPVHRARPGRTAWRHGDRVEPPGRGLRAEVVLPQAPVATMSAPTQSSETRDTGSPQT